jgi:hypothetical protein
MDQQVKWVAKDRNSRDSLEALEHTLLQHGLLVFDRFR